MIINPLDLGMLPESQVKVSTDNKLFRAVKKVARQVLEGDMISIDPSVGSGSSMPGYAVFKKGKLIDYGIISLNPKLNQFLRLYELGRSLREEFSRTKWDVLVVEAIPTVRFQSYGRSLSAQVPLHRAVGTVLASVRADHLLEVPPQTWHKFVVPAYSKSDDKDAVAFGYTVLCYARAALSSGGRS